MTEPKTSRPDFVTEDEEDSLEGCTVCPVCLCSGIRLGTLGDKTHFRCRGCGINFYAGITLAD